MDKNSRRRKKNSRKKRILLIVVFFIISISAVLLKSKVFKIQTIEVKGNYHISKDAVIERSKALDKNIFFISKKTIEDNILKDDIKKVAIKKKLPSTIEISLVENRSIAYVQESDSKYYYINIDGYIEGNTEEKPENIPSIQGVSLNILHEGRSIFEDNDIEIIFKEIDKQKLKIVDYDFSDSDNIILKTEENSILLGNNTELSEKISILKDILSSDSTKDIKIKEINIMDFKKPVIVEE